MIPSRVRPRSRIVVGLGTGLAGILAALTASCSAAPGDETWDEEVLEDTGEVEAPILNGTTIAETDSGVVTVSFDSPCTGTLLKNQWVLTAAHCVQMELDDTFERADDGVVIGGKSAVEIQSVAVDASGATVVAGRITGGATGDRFYLFRYTATGTIDLSFGASGEVISDLAGSTAEGIQDIALQSDGKILAAGWATVNGSKQLAIARYTTAGVLDSTFGTSGRTFTDFSTSSSEWVEGLTLDASGRAVVAGVAAGGVSTIFALARYTTVGALDTTFGSSGRVTTNFTGQWGSGARDVAVDGSGRIVAAGYSYQDTVDTAAVARYTATGALDTTFDGDGMVLIDDASDANGAESVLIQATKIIVGGTHARNAGVWRLTSTGALDTTFGSAGLAQPLFPNQSFARVESMAFKSDGKIRLGVDLWHTTDGRRAGLATLSSSGATSADRVNTSHHGFSVDSHHTGNDVATSMALSGSRVLIAGTLNPGTAGSRASLVVLQPERTSNLAVRNAYADMAGQHFVPIDQAFLPSSTDDVAIVHLSAGITMNGSTTGYTFPGFVTDFNALVGTDVLCRGYGDNALDGTGSGVLRRGTSRVVGLTTRYVTIDTRPSGTQQAPLSGDSGSSCTSGGLLIGVHSLRATGGTRGSEVRANRFAAWASGLIAGP